MIYLQTKAGAHEFRMKSMNVFHPKINFSRTLNVVAAVCFLIANNVNPAVAQISATANTNATQLAQALVGSGVTVTNATLICRESGAGFFTATAQTLGIGQGVVLTSGYAQDPDGFGFDISSPNDAGGTTGGFDLLPGDPQLQTLAANTTFDACILEFDVVPQGDTIKFDYIFGSEEYNDYVNAGFNDVFGFFISGPGILGQQNIAVVPGTSVPVAIDNVNCGSYSQYYVCNDPWDPFGGGCSGACPNSPTTWGAEYDGLTTMLTAKAVVQPCQSYHLKLGVADVGDEVLDSGVFIKQGSLTSATVEASPDVTICPGQSTQLNVTGTSAGSTFTWSPATALSCTNCIDPIANPTVTTTYTVSISSSGACAGTAITDQVVVTVGGGIQGSATPTAATCGSSDGLIDLNVTSGTAPYTYNWSNGATTEDLNNVAAGSYTVTVTDVNNCNATFSADVITTGGATLTSTITDATCSLANGSIDITINGGAAPYNYSWSNGNVGEDANGLVGGTYSVSITDAVGCELDETFTVNTTTIPNIAFASTGPFCTSATGFINATITMGTAPYTFNWNNGESTEDINNLTEGMYELTVSDNAGCTSSFATTLTATAGPDIAVNGLVDSLCVGESFTATASGYDSYAWTPAAGLSSTVGSDVEITVNTNQTYTVVGTDANGCVDEFVFDVTAVPFAQVSFTETFNGCEPLTVDLNASASNVSSVQWWIDGLYWSNQLNTAYTFYAGTHDGLLIAVSPLGCNDTIAMPDFANVMSSPNADFDVTLDVSSGSLFNFNFTNNTTNATSYIWNFGDATTDTVTNPYHIYPSYGSFPVLLTAYNQNGCSDTALKIVNVIIPKNVFIPNTITPNGDGMNETLKVYGLGIADYKLKVFNRLGELVFDGTDSRAHWDGTYKGQPLNIATFVYLAEVEFLDGQRQKYWGDVNILR